MPKNYCIMQIWAESGKSAKHFVPDNLKTAVTKHTKDDLVLQSTFSDLEDFYDTIVLPPPARKPKGKPTVENHVRYLETHLIEKLKENIYTYNNSYNIASSNHTKCLCYNRFFVADYHDECYIHSLQRK